MAGITTLFAVVLVVHAVIHLLGFAKAFGLAELPQLTQPISPGLGVLWLVAAVLFVATAVAVFTWPRGWWGIGTCAIVVSMSAIVPSWTDAKYGALAKCHRADWSDFWFPVARADQPEGALRS